MYNVYNTAVTWLEHKSNTEYTTGTDILNLIGELWDVLREYFNGNWP